MQYLSSRLLSYRTSVPPKDDFSERLSALARQKGLDVTALSRASGLKEGAIYKLLRGDQKTTSLQAGLRLAEALGVNPWVLAFGAERGAGVSFFSPEADPVAALKAQIERVLGSLDAYDEDAPIIQRIDDLEDAAAGDGTTASESAPAPARRRGGRG